MGGLDVRIHGLPEGLPASVTYIDPDGRANTLTAPGRLTGLLPGSYAFVVAEVCASPDRPCPETSAFRPVEPAFAVDVVAGAVVEVDVRYGCALLVPPDPALAGALLDAVRHQLGDPDASLSCANVGALTSFSPASVGIVDLSGLEEARSLEVLNLSRNPGVVSLAPIAGLSALTELRVGYAGMGTADASIDDLSPIAGLANLETLYVGHVRATELPDLSRLAALRSLSLVHVDLSDLGPLSGATDLTDLDLDYCVGSRPGTSALADVSPLLGLRKLTTLRLGCHAIEDVAALANMTQLRLLDLQFNDVADISPLLNLVSLEAVILDENARLRDLSVVVRWPRLAELSARITGVDDLRPLFLHAQRYDTLRTVDLSLSCVASSRVPNAGYASAIGAAGVELQASARGAACGFGLVPPPALATFEVDTEGWTTAGDAVDLRRLAVGGPTGGAYLEADDGQAGVAWYWQAGPAFLGDAAFYQGGELRSFLKQDATDAPSSGTDVVLVGAGRTLTFQHGVPIGTDWTEVRVPLVASAGWWAGSVAASDADLAEVLGDVTRLWLRGEYRFGADTGGLGYVELVPAPGD
jgi:hypothetical protein